MYHFTVWAPKSKAVAVRVNGETHPMQCGERGWWSADVASAKPGDDYGFLLDDDAKAYSDPRSKQQPDGVHGLSRIVHFDRFKWTDGHWSAPPWAEAVVYELHTGTFTPEGTFRAAAEKLGYLRSIGVTHVELMPINSFPGHWGWGYDGVSLFAPQEDYGGPEGLQYFIDRAHAEGLAVLLDVVYNHFGPDGNYTGVFGPYITESHQTPWGGAINFEESGSTEVRRFFCDNALMWLRDYHFDGLRLDAIQTYIDRSAIHFLEQLSTEVEALSKEVGRTFVLVAESDLNDPRIVTPRAEGGYGIDAQWSDDFHHSLFALLTGEHRTYYADFGKLAQLAKSLTSVFVFNGNYSYYRGRLQGRPVEGLNGHRFLGYIQNHDQIGNRTFGDRLHMEAGERAAKLAAALVFTAPFTPMIFMGEEFAANTPFLYFAHHEDPELAASVSEGRRREHEHEENRGQIPDPEKEDSFLRSKLNWKEFDEPGHADMLDWYRKLIKLRSDHEALRDGRLDLVRVDFDEDAKWLVMQRQEIHLLFNFSDVPVTFPAPDAARILLQSDKAVTLHPDSAQLPALSFVALAIKSI